MIKYHWLFISTIITVSQAGLVAIDSVTVDSVWNSDSSWYDGNGILQNRISRDANISFFPRGNGTAICSLAISLDSGKTFNPTPNPLRIISPNTDVFSCNIKNNFVARVLTGDKGNIVFRISGDSCSSTPIISDAEEIKIGNMIKVALLSDSINYPIYKKYIKVNRYVDSIGQLIANAQKDRDTLKFTFSVIDNDSTINAFALPGGHVFIYSGLIKSLSNEAELAGVLAHEIGHITKYHGVYALAAAYSRSLLEQSLYGDPTTTAQATALIVESLIFLRFSRDNEYEADSCAVAYNMLIEHNPYGIRDFLISLRNKYGEQPKIFEPLSTHPNITDRIARIQSLINKTSWALDQSTGMFPTKFIQIKSSL